MKTCIEHDLRTPNNGPWISLMIISREKIRAKKKLIQSKVWPLANNKGQEKEWGEGVLGSRITLHESTFEN